MIAISIPSDTLILQVPVAFRSQGTSGKPNAGLNRRLGGLTSVKMLGWLHFQQVALLLVPQEKTKENATLNYTCTGGQVCSWNFQEHRACSAFGYWISFSPLQDKYDMSLAAAFYSPTLNFTVASGYTDAGSDKGFNGETVAALLTPHTFTDECVLDNGKQSKRSFVYIHFYIHATFLCFAMQSRWWYTNFPSDRYMVCESPNRSSILMED